LAGLSSNEEKITLQIIITSGKDNIHKAVLGFASAASAAASGSKVLVYLTMNGAHWASETTGNDIELEGWQPIADYIDIILELDSCVKVCTTCAKYYCPAPVDKNDNKILRKGIEMEGLASMTLRLEKVPSISF